MKKNSTTKQQKTNVQQTTAENLEARFDAGENVLDYFNLSEGRILWIKKNTAQKLASLRTSAGMTQKQFSEAMCISPRTLQQWEQGCREPAGPAKALLRLIAMKPSLIKFLAKA